MTPHRAYGTNFDDYATTAAPAQSFVHYQITAFHPWGRQDVGYFESLVESDHDAIERFMLESNIPLVMYRSWGEGRKPDCRWGIYQWEHGEVVPIGTYHEGEPPDPERKVGESE